VVALVLLGWDAIRHDVVPKRLVPVDEDYLFRSGQISEALIGSVIDDYGFDSVIALTSVKREHPDHIAEVEATRSRGVSWTNYPLRGNGTGDPENYVSALTEIHRVRSEGGRVLVHCASGVRRAAGVPSVYRVLVEGHAPDVVYAEELDRFVGPFELWGPRPAWESKIIPYLNENMGLIAQRLVEEGVLSAVPDPIPQFVPPSA
jgi:protein tyrosine phosphatase (PTP) superfamily phosphohydrolase (DUF442 family)